MFVTAAGTGVGMEGSVALATTTEVEVGCVVGVDGSSVGVEVISGSGVGGDVGVDTT